MNEVQIEDPGGLLQPDPTPEELDITTDLEEQYYNADDDSSCDSNPAPGLRRQAASVASSDSSASSDGEHPVWYTEKASLRAGHSSSGDWRISI